MYVCMYVCYVHVCMYVSMSVTLRNANFDTLRTRISVSCMLRVRKGCGRTIVVNVASNGKKTMHANAMDGSISTEDEDSDQRRRRL